MHLVSVRSDVHKPLQQREKKKHASNTKLSSCGCPLAAPRKHNKPVSAIKGSAEPASPPTSDDCPPGRVIYEGIRHGTMLADYMAIGKTHAANRY